MPVRRHPSLLRIAATMAICLAISAVAVLLGTWQLGRHQDRADARADYDAAVEHPVADLRAVVPADAASLPDGAQWRTVTASGRFDPDSLTVLRGRPVDGTPAWQYLGWLDTDDGASLLVNLGWISQPGPLEDPAMPELSQAGEVTVDVVLRAWEEDDGKPATDSITRITPAQLPEPRLPAVPGYGMLRTCEPAAGCAYAAVGSPVPLPELTLGPHLSYAWQWWLFAAMAPAGGILLLRRDAKMGSEAQPAPASSAPRRRRLTDEEIEDAL